MTISENDKDTATWLTLFLMLYVGLTMGCASKPVPVPEPEQESQYNQFIWGDRTGIQPGSPLDLMKEASLEFDYAIRRIQIFEGLIIGRRRAGYRSSITVRKLSGGIGVERVFPVYSPIVEGVKVQRRGKVRRAKLYYLRSRRGKSARIVEKTNYKPKRDAASAD